MNVTNKYDISKFEIILFILTFYLIQLLIEYYFKWNLEIKYEYNLLYEYLKK
jgi:hypothetical protein